MTSFYLQLSSNVFPLPHSSPSPHLQGHYSRIIRQASYVRSNIRLQAFHFLRRHNPLCSRRYTGMNIARVDFSLHLGSHPTGMAPPRCKRRMTRNSRPVCLSTQLSEASRRRFLRVQSTLPYNGRYSHLSASEYFAPISLTLLLLLLIEKAA